MQIRGHPGNKPGEMLPAPSQGVQISTDTEKAAPRVDQDRPDVRADCAFGGEMIEFFGEPIVERIAAISLISL